MRWFVTALIVGLCAIFIAFGQRPLRVGTARVESSKPLATIVTLPEVRVQLQDNSLERTIKVTFQAEAEDEATRDALAQKLPQLNEMVVTFLSHRPPTSLDGSVGIQSTKRALLERINHQLGAHLVKNLYVSELVTYGGVIDQQE